MIDTAPATDEPVDDGTSRLLLLMEESEDRRLLEAWLGQRYAVTVGATEPTIAQPFDLCLVSAEQFARHTEALAERKSQTEQIFLPYLIVLQNRSADDLDARIWELVDEVVEAPIGKAELRSRLVGLLARRSQSQSLVARKERIRRVLETIPDPILVVDDEGIVVDANPAFGNHVGADTPELVGSTLTDVSAFPPETVSVLLAITTRGASSEAGEPESAGDTAADERTLVTYDTAAGTTRFAEVAAAPLPGGGGDEWLFFLRDVTDGIERERALERERDRISSFADMLAHEIRNPLNIAQGFLDQVLANDEHEELALERVRNAHTRMEQMVTELLTHARGKWRGQVERVDLVRIARNSWNLTPTADASLEFTVEELFVEADPNNLQTILQTMFRNAVQHAGPSTTIRVGPTEQGFYVADDGDGIPPDEREAVFERGYTRGSAGTGLGLALVREIADAHGWGVSVTESETGGTRFEFLTEHETERTPSP